PPFPYPPLFRSHWRARPATPLSREHLGPKVSQGIRETASCRDAILPVPSLITFRAVFHSSAFQLHTFSQCRTHSAYPSGRLRDSHTVLGDKPPIRSEERRVGK